MMVKVWKLEEMYDCIHKIQRTLGGLIVRGDALEEESSREDATDGGDGKRTQKKKLDYLWREKRGLMEGTALMD